MQLKAQFDSDATASYYVALLNRRQRLEKEGIQQLVNNLLELAAKVYPSIDFETRKTICIEPFINSLSDLEQRKAVLYACPDSLKKAAKVTLAYENAVRVETLREKSVPYQRSSLMFVKFH